MKYESVVIDTNVLVAALRSSAGGSYQLLRHIDTGLYVPCVTVPLFVEYESVLKRPDMVPALSSSEIDDVLDYLLSRARLITVHYLWRPHLSDPKDDCVLEAAVASGSTQVITFNHRDFRGIATFGLESVSPATFLRERGIIE